MRLIKDDSYVFSLSNNSFGKIIVARAKSCGVSPGGIIYDRLGIQKHELDFLYSRFSLLGNSPIAIVCGEGNQRVAVFIRFFSGSTSLCLAVSFDLPACHVAAVLKNCFMGELHLSPAIISLASLEVGDTDPEIYSYISLMFASLSGLHRIACLKAVCAPHLMLDAARDLCSFLDVSLEGDVLRNGDISSVKEAGRIFCGEAFAACLTVLGMSARGLSHDRHLRMRLLQGYRDVRVCFSLKTHSDLTDIVDALRSSISLCGSELCEINNGEEWQLELSPYYSDVGLVGLKQGEWRRGITWRKGIKP